MRYLIAVACSLLSVTAFAETRTYHVKTDESVLTYRVSAAGGMDKVESQSHKVEGSANLSIGGGPAQITLRVPVASFDSKNEKRDAKMREVTDAAHFPNVEVKVTHDDLVTPSLFPNSMTKTFKAAIEFHGITQTVDVPVTMNFESTDRVIATVFCKLSLGSFKVERPKKMLFQVADELLIEGKIVFTQ